MNRACRLTAILAFVLLLSTVSAFGQQLPTPVITAVNPNEILAGSGTTIITVFGDNFAQTAGQFGAHVLWNGVGLATTWTSDAQVRATVPASLLTQPGPAAVVVRNVSTATPSVQSNTFTVQVTLPLAITSLNPSSVPAGTTNCALQVLGQAFEQSIIAGDGFTIATTTRVQWNGDPLTTQLINSTQLLAAIPPQLTQAPDQVKITAVKTEVTNGQTTQRQISNALDFTVRPPAALDSVAPNLAVAGTPGMLIDVVGANLAQTSVIFFDGAALETQFVGATRLRAFIPANLLQQPRVVLVEVRENVCGQTVISNSLNFTIQGLRITSVSPAAAPAGSPPLFIDVTGQGFSQGMDIRWNQQVLPTQFVNNTTLRAQVSAALLAQPMTAQVAVEIGDTDIISNSLPFVVYAFALTSLDPPARSAGASAFTLGVLGRGFDEASVVRWNGQNLATIFVSPTRLDATVPASLLTLAGTANVTVQSGVANVISNSLPFSIGDFNILSLVPNRVYAGTGGFELMIQGQGFEQNSVARWNGMALPTTFVDSGALRATISAALVAEPGTSNVTVFNPTTGAQTAPAIFTVRATAITQLDPASAAAGSPAFTLAVIGEGFTPDWIVQWGGVDLPTTFVNAGRLSAEVPAAFVASSGTAPVRAVNTVNGLVTAAVNFTITASLRVTGVNPDSFTTGSGPVTMTVTGIDLTPTTVVQWNGITLETQFVQATEVRATVTNAQLAAIGSYNVRVFDPESGLVSNSLPVAVGLPTSPPSEFVEAMNGSFQPIRTESAPAEQVEFDVNFSESYNLDQEVQATLSFTPASGVDAAQNPSVAFTNHDPGNQNQATVQVPAGQQLAGFAQAGNMIATGTIAGEILVTLRTWAVSNGQRVSETTPDPAPTARIQVQGGAPQITSACFTRSGANLVVQVMGFAPNRSITAANFTFSGNSNLQTTSVNLTDPVAGAFSTWYSNPESLAFGSSFTYTQPFTISGTAGDVTGVSGVTLSTGGQQSVRFTQVSQCP